MNFKLSVEAAYTIEATPQWNEHKVEEILKSKHPLSESDRKELHKAMDYYEYLNDMSDDESVLEQVTDQLVRIADRMEIDLGDKPEHHHESMH